MTARHAKQTEFPMDRFYQNVYRFVDTGAYRPIRLMAVECGGVIVGERLFEYLKENGIRDLGIFSVDISRRSREVKNRKQIEAEMKRYPNFLRDSLLIGIDDVIISNTVVRDVLAKEVNHYFKPRFGVKDYAFAAVVSGLDKNERPLAQLHGSIVTDDSYDHIPYSLSSHIPPTLNADDIAHNNDRLVDATSDAKGITEKALYHLGYLASWGADVLGLKTSDTSKIPRTSREIETTEEFVNMLVRVE